MKLKRFIIHSLLGCIFTSTQMKFIYHLSKANFISIILFLRFFSHQYQNFSIKFFGGIFFMNLSCYIYICKQLCMCNVSIYLLIGIHVYFLYMIHFIIPREGEKKDYLSASSRRTSCLYATTIFDVNSEAKVNLKLAQQVNSQFTVCKE